MKPCILQDSSFIIALLKEDDSFHNDALRLSKSLSKYKQDIKFVIPSIVFFEVFATLIKKGIPKKVVEKSLWRFLHQDNILTVSVIETMAFRLGNRLQSKFLSGLKTSDFVITTIGLDYDAYLCKFRFKSGLIVRLSRNLQKEGPAWAQSFTESAGEPKLNKGIKAAIGCCLVSSDFRKINDLKLLPPGGNADSYCFLRL